MAKKNKKKNFIGSFYTVNQRGAASLAIAGDDKGDMYMLFLSLGPLGV